MKIKVTSIKWDTDGESPKPKLPKQMAVELTPEELSGDDTTKLGIIADKLSNETGWAVSDFKVELPTIPTPQELNVEAIRTLGYAGKPPKIINQDIKPSHWLSEFTKKYVVQVLFANGTSITVEHGNIIGQTP